MKFLILGATSYIGNYIYNRMNENHIAVVGTYCHKSYSDEMVHFDIQYDDVDSLLCSMKRIPDIAIICIAQTNFDCCADDYETAYNINVTCMKKLIDDLNMRRIKVIYISSDNVFDGKKGNYTEQDATNAIGKYGMMKEEMEHYILDKFTQMCILRIAKPVSAGKAQRNLLTEWVQNRNMNKTIRCIRNNYISFVAIEDIFKICVLAGEKDLKGLYNIAGDMTYSRKELAMKFFHYLGADTNQIVECDLREFGFKDTRPLNISMSNNKIKKTLNYQFIDVECILKKYVELMN